MVTNKLQAVIGKFVSPSTAVPNALQSCLSSDDTLVGGGGVWHWVNNFCCPRLLWLQRTMPLRIFCHKTKFVSIFGTCSQSHYLINTKIATFCFALNLNHLDPLNSTFPEENCNMIKIKLRNYPQCTMYSSLKNGKPKFCLSFLSATMYNAMKLMVNSK
jgi:hypothetical protein